MSHPISFSRRTTLKGAFGVVVASSLFPGLLRAQEGPIVLGTLTPLTGAGGPYGPIMRDAAAAVVGEVNRVGGILGRQIKLVSEDDQTNPEAAVRAAHKLINVDRVSAIIGTWASSVTSAVAPLCWESKTFLTTVSGADSITQLPHQGYVARTQPNTALQGRKFADVALDLRAKKIQYMGPQTPFAQSIINAITEATAPSGAVVTSLIYDGQKTSYRSEVDQVMRAKPDTIVMGGFAPDTTVLLKDIYRVGFTGNLVAFGFAVPPKLLDELPAEATEGIYVVSPSPAIDSNAYKRLAALLNRSELDTYTCQVYDQTSLMLLAMAAGGNASGTGIRDHLRRVSQGGGLKVDNALDGLKLLAEKRKIDYDGASGPCEFNEIGDILDARFRFERIKSRKPTLIKIV